MSLILDALRKSEAERQRGQSPSLYSAMPVPSTRRAPAWLRLLPVLLGALLLLAAGWFALRNAGEPATQAQPEPQADAGESSSSEDPGIALAPAAAHARLSVQPAEPRAPELPAAALPTPAPAPPPQAATPAPAADTPPASAPATSEAAPPAQLPREPAESSAPADALPPVAVLDAGTRSALPPMKLSMHVYNADPSRRFAIIDGQRVVEGAQLGAASVAEIRRDGVVLDVHGRRVLLPRP